MPRRTQVFISYSHQDRPWLERLQVHLAPLVRRGAIELWDDTRIRAGDRWREEIQSALDRTRVAILLVSADFMASEFIDSEELPPLLRAQETGGVAILPVILSPSSYQQTPELARFQSVNDPSEPLIGMSTVDQEYLLSNIAHEVRLRAASPERAEAPVTAPESAEQQASAPSAPRENLSDLQERVRATRELAATFAPERYAYMALVSACLIALLAFCGKLVFGDVGSTPQQVTLMTSALGAGGAASFFGGQLLRIRRRLFDFVEEASTLSGSVS